MIDGLFDLHPRARCRHEFEELLRLVKRTAAATNTAVIAMVTSQTVWALTQPGYGHGVLALDEDEVADSVVLVLGRRPPPPGEASGYSRARAIVARHPAMLEETVHWMRKGKAGG